MGLEESIRKHALENAVKFNGKANPGAIVGKLLSEDPSLKQQMKDISPKIQTIIKKVNNISLEEQKEELLKLDPNYFSDQKEKKKERQEQRKELPELRNAVDGKVVTRISPEPSKYNHLGHAISFLLNHMYAIKYNGKCHLRFEDTNPEKASQEFVEAMQHDVLEYLDIKVDSTVFVSDHMEKYFEMADELISNSNAYTCSCKSVDISKMRREMIDCKCRNKSKDQIKKEWQEMKEGTIPEGSLVLRLKIDMQHKNAVMRDPVIFRLCYTQHYRQAEKYKVWPMYDFENAIEEGLMGVTHVLRSNEFESRIELQDHIRDLFKLPNPTVKQYARFNVTDAVTKGREIRELIESGDYIGWDDPRLVTLRALRRRGIVKESYSELAKVIGMSKSTSNLDFSVIAAINRKILDDKAHRFFFIHDAHKVSIKDAPMQEFELDLHPHFKKKGRKFKTHDTFYLSKKDLAEIKDGELVRLMDCLNFRREGDNFTFDSLEVEKFKKEGSKIIHWLPAGDVINVEMLLPDCTKIQGYAEKNIEALNQNDVVQFERYAFCRLDSKDPFKFWYGHN